VKLNVSFSYVPILLLVYLNGHNGERRALGVLGTGLERVAVLMERIGCFARMESLLHVHASKNIATRLRLCY